MSARPLIYIAGPFSGPDRESIERNIAAAEAVHTAMACGDIFAICPHSQGRNMIHVRDQEYWLRATSRMLMACDAMVVLPGWQGSEGTQSEIEMAKDRGKPICYIESLSFDDVLDCVGWCEALPDVAT